VPESFMKKIMSPNFLIYFFIWGIAFLVRWYALPSHLFFGFEQGRDAIVATDISQGKDFVLVGPKTDIGGVFHGVWYYYLLAIPYGLSGGNPLVASAVLVALSSLVPVLFYFWGRKLWPESRWLPVLLTVLAVMSYESIQYSRWLSNVTPALFLVPLCAWTLWQYQQSNHPKWWLLGQIFAAFAAQFEVILTLWYGWWFLMLLSLKVVKLPSWKTLAASILVWVFWFIPMILFNVRNDFISFKSAQAYLTESKADSTEALPVTIIKTVPRYGAQLTRLVKTNLFPQHNGALWAFTVVVAIGLGLAARQRETRRQILFFVLWLTMRLPVLLYRKSIDLPQLYIGSGLATLFLFVLSIKGWLTLRQKSRLVLAGALILLACVVWHWPTTARKLQANEDVFYRTIQDDLNYQDQKELLAWLAQDAGDQTVYVKSYSIPYFHEEAWQYLRNYHQPQLKTGESAIIYLIIEKPVDPYWIKTWTKELGETELVETKHFGLITLEKRLKKS
jgi:hypothetical protein